MAKKRILPLLASLFGVCVMGLADAGAADVESTWHGQFRINSYYQDAGKESSFGADEDVLASRLRFRPTWDLKFPNGVGMHMQLNIGHINSNTANARFNQTGDPAVGLRHGYVFAPIPGYENWTVLGGLIPVPDKFGDTLFSSDWDFNPLTFALMGKVGDISIRAAHGNLVESNEEAGTGTGADDVDAWVFDADTAMGLGVSYYAVNDNSKPSNTITGGASQTNEHYVGVRYAGKLEPVDFNAFAIYNWGKRKGFTAGAAERDNSGYAVKAEGKVPVGPAKIGVMGLYASGDKDFADSAKDDSSAFITPMSLIAHTGYWGYTGKINVQGPTDTGVDGQAINIDGKLYSSGSAPTASNLGTGIWTIQANASFPIIEGRLDGYLAAGYFAAADAQTGKDDYVGTDLYGQVKYMFGSGLNLEAGVDYVSLGEGHPDAIGLATPETRNMTLVFSRLQLEF